MRRISLVLLLALAGCRTGDRVVVPSRGAEPARRGAARRLTLSRAMTTEGGRYLVEFALRGPADGRLRFAIDQAAFEASDSRWGYSEGDLAALRQAYEASRVAAFEDAERRQHTQAQLDEALRPLHARYEEERRAYILRQGFRFRPDGRVQADLAALARANAARLAPLAKELMDIAAARGYSREWVVDAATALVQTSVEYRPVPAVVGGRHTGGVWPPLAALVYGWGDCDTKGPLLAGILANVPGLRIMGVETAGHFLLAVSGEPGKGDAFLRHGGRKYVMIEPAGPDWIAPGDLGDDARKLFERGGDYRVEPLF